ncbi:uncharacterized protein LOC120355183 [Nilaparvata lugens]|uniref:uncharacterized protein LOC120355183 n=1 Tax=Nilaparvata lugens TaxID=108931 RepID=UPI000B98B32C|nr:uncharacterized protein LOC120355183 [Nilaparvata lugens]
MTGECHTCKNPVSNPVKCPNCATSFHQNCIIVNKKCKTWKCEKCSKDISTSISDKRDIENNNSILNAINEFRMENKQNWDSNNKRWDVNEGKLKELQEDIKATNLEISLIKEQFTEVSNKCDNACAAVEKFRQENTLLKGELAQVKNDLVDLQQHTRKNNILVTGIPVTYREDMFTVLDAVARTIDVNFNYCSDISAVHRLHNRKDDNRPPPIVINFTSRIVKSNWLAARRLKGSLTASELNVNFPNTPVYLNEHLTTLTRSIFNSARQLVKDKKLHSVWTADCKVMAKTAVGQRPFRVRDMEHIAELREKRIETSTYANAAASEVPRNMTTTHQEADQQSPK